MSGSFFLIVIVFYKSLLDAPALGSNCFTSQIYDHSLVSHVHWGRSQPLHQVANFCRMLLSFSPTLAALISLYLGISLSEGKWSYTAEVSHSLKKLGSASNSDVWKDFSVFRFVFSVVWRSIGIGTCKATALLQSCVCSPKKHLCRVIYWLQGMQYKWEFLVRHLPPFQTGTQMCPYCPYSPSRMDIFLVVEHLPRVAVSSPVSANRITRSVTVPWQLSEHTQEEKFSKLHRKPAV